MDAFANSIYDFSCGTSTKIAAGNIQVPANIPSSSNKIHAFSPFTGNNGANVMQCNDADKTMINNLLGAVVISLPRNAILLTHFQVR